MKGIIAVACLAFGLAAPVVSAAEQGAHVVHQLRIYEIFEHNKQAFHDRFRDHAMRIMARYDFHILGMWEAKGEDRTEFVYLLEWPDEATLKDRWEKFLADEEWKEIKRETAEVYGDLVGEIEERTMKLAAYSVSGEVRNIARGRKGARCIVRRLKNFSANPIR